MSKLGIIVAGLVTISACVDGDVMGTSSHAGEAIQVVCDQRAGAVAMPDGFTGQFCKQLQADLVNKLGDKLRGAKVEVVLSRAGQYQLQAVLTTVSAAGDRDTQDLTMTIMDSEPKPSMAKGLVFPIAKMLGAA